MIESTNKAQGGDQAGQPGPAAKSRFSSILEFRSGIHLIGTGLWLDATAVKEISFVSHAHKDHFARHKSIIATEQTIRLCRERLDINEALTVPYRQPFSLGELTLELYPAGHMLGSAQVLIKLPESKGGIRIGYTGDFNTECSMTAEKAEQMKCDVLVIESTFGNPTYVMPPKEKVLDDIAAFSQRCFSETATPVIFAYSVGKAQEVIKQLEARGLDTRVHKTIWEFCKVYEEFGVGFTRLHKLVDESRRGEVVILPSIPGGAGRGKVFSQLRSPKTAVVTGWAIDQGTKYSYGVDEAFPLSDHADFNRLIAYVEGSGAKKIFVTHGQVDDFVKILRDRGFDAEPIIPPAQLSLF